MLLSSPSQNRPASHNVLVRISPRIKRNKSNPTCSPCTKDTARRCHIELRMNSHGRRKLFFTRRQNVCQLTPVFLVSTEAYADAAPVRSSSHFTLTVYLFRGATARRGKSMRFKLCHGREQGILVLAQRVSARDFSRLLCIATLRGCLPRFVRIAISHKTPSAINHVIPGGA
jgi:hypothetical protein